MTIADPSSILELNLSPGPFREIPWDLVTDAIHREATALTEAALGPEPHPAYHGQVADGLAWRPHNEWWDRYCAEIRRLASGV